MRDYTSKISPLMREFEQYRLASGRWSENYNIYLTPRLADIMAEHTNEDETIPEVPYKSY